MGNATRRVNPQMFAGAIRYHTGGVAGLRPGEVPLIAKKGEEILTQEDPRHMLNGGGAAGPTVNPATNVKIVNTFDSGDFVSQGLQTRKGERAIMNFVRANSDSIRREIGV
jgi:hypothetical protein